ncbi:rod shape-determining protein MreC [Prochlorococcus sp. AH-716-E13]|nr:rod shape-determining protein MreC [Prochlorococcus sp. AH-716-E13]
MVDIRRISTNRWWHKKNNWSLFIFLSFLIFVRISKGSLYKDFYYLISRPFWPGQFQKEVLVKSVEQEFLIRLKQLEKDNKRLREILSLQRLSDSESISANVISRKTGSFWRQIILNKGTKDGVEIGSFVIGPGGLLGRVINTSVFTSSVKLLTSPESKVGVWIERIQMHGLLVGSGNDYPKVIFYNKEVDVKVGDFVLSSPASTLLPPNIPIGIIQSVDEEIKAKKTANILLLGKPQAIDWVQILKVEM